MLGNKTVIRGLRRVKEFRVLFSDPAFLEKELELFELVSVSHKLGKFVVIKFHHNLLILCCRKGKFVIFFIPRSFVSLFTKFRIKHRLYI